ncbi:restriction endonuclease subunit S [Pasteurella multocida]|uniref:restriction endonuclease subunit S n=1 Tax=Pasteurella multocida TaxID=747 RepID=UPI003CFB2083
MKAQQLKNAILQLAIQGKLVPQDPNDEPAQVLLEKINKEKEQLIAEGKIKKSKKTSEKNPYVDQTEFPFEIPDSWVWVKLGDLLTVSSGKNLIKSRMTNGCYPVYGGNGINGYYDNYLVEKNTIIIGRVGFYCGTVHKTFSRSWVTDNALIVKQIYNCFIPDFLLYLLNYFDLKKISVATAQPVISGERIYNTFIPLLSISEQKRIVAKIEALLPFVEQYAKKEQELTTLHQSFPSQLKKSILQAAIQGKLVEQNPQDEPAMTLIARIQAEKERLISEKKLKKPKQQKQIFRRDNSHYELIDGVERCIDEELPFEIPDSWCWVRLGDIGEWGSGSTPDRNEPLYYFNGTIPWLKTGDLNDGVIKNIPEKITELALQKTSVKLNPIGSVLIAMYGATIGKLGILNIEATTNQACCACIPHQEILNTYLFYYLMAQKSEFQKKSEGSGQPNISKEKIINFLFALPPYNEQKRIVEKIEELFSHLQKLEKN